MSYKQLKIKMIQKYSTYTYSIITITVRVAEQENKGELKEIIFKTK